MNSLKKLNLKNKRVFVRVDFNVPLKNGKVADDYRIRNALPTLNYILSKNPKQLIIGTHLGRPNGFDKKFSLVVVAKKLATLIERPVYLHEDVLSPIKNDEPIVLLENLRFWEGEKKGSISFAKTLASYVDVYVDDAFGTAHRKDASVYALAKLLPGAPGFLIEKEIKHVNLSQKRPLVAIFGAAKISDKLPIFKKLLSEVDKLILGGGVVFTFLQAAGVEVGKSLVEKEMVGEARKLLKKYSSKLVFPVDFVVAKPSALKKSGKVECMIVPFDAIPKSYACYDVGPKSVKLFKAVLGASKSVVWNGPLGLFERKPFDKATRSVAKFISESKMVSIICGGDTALSVRGYKMTHVSTGGGASLELLAGKKLPALVALDKK